LFLFPLSRNLLFTRFAFRRSLFTDRLRERFNTFVSVTFGQNQILDRIARDPSRPTAGNIKLDFAGSRVVSANAGRTSERGRKLDSPAIGQAARKKSETRRSSNKLPTRRISVTLSLSPSFTVQVSFPNIKSCPYRTFGPLGFGFPFGSCSSSTCSSSGNSSSGIGTAAWSAMWPSLTHLRHFQLVFGDRNRAFLFLWMLK
jgi:hypothetical protein